MLAVEPTLLQGTLDLVILRTLVRGPAHGYTIVRWIKTTSDDAVRVEDRALYLALHRLEARGLVASDWGVSENNRRARFYTLTETGRAALAVKTAAWTDYVTAISKILRAEPVGPTEVAR